MMGTGERRRVRGGASARARGAGLAGLSAAVAVLAAAGSARATNGLESPDIGVVQVGRGGAWLARADDPLAFFYNPAGLASQAHGIHVGMHFLFRSQCFDRMDENGVRPSPGSSLEPAPGPVCSDTVPIPNPQLAANIRLHEKVALGFGVVAPHAAGLVTWPESLTYANRFGVETEHPAPTRYLMTADKSLLLFPTVSVGVAPIEEFAFGVGLTWGVARLEFSSMNEAVSGIRGTPQPDDFTGDVKSTIDGVDGFVPGIVVGVQATPHERVQLAAWYRYSDAVRANVDLYGISNYYTLGGAVNPAAPENPANITDQEDAGRAVLPVPMEAKLGVRYRHPRKNAHSQAWATDQAGRVLDPMASEVFDIEVDFTWAHNSQFEALELAFGCTDRTPDQCHAGLTDVPIVGTPGNAPRNGDIPHNWRDVFGARWGGDYNVVPDLLALRVGGFVESKGGDDAYVHPDFAQGMRGGVGGGLTVRLSFVDLSAAYQHTFYTTQDNGGAGAIRAISGDLTTDNRSRQVVNGGKLTANLNEIALGATFHIH